MTLLNRNSRGAERQRGCLFAESFASQALVEENGGTVGGTPTFNLATGVTLNGTSEYVEYELQGHELSGPERSFVMEFTPTFDYDEDKNTYLFETSTNQDFLLKRNNTNSNRLMLRIGGTTIGTIDQATYSPHWKVNERNVLVISSESTTTYVWLNGVEVMTDDGSAYTAEVETSLHIGINAGMSDGRYFGGSVKRFAIFAQTLSEGEAIDLYNETTWTWRERALVELPMLNGNVVGTKTTNAGTLGSAADASYGAGAAAPTKSTWRRGYDIADD